MQVKKHPKKPSIKFSDGKLCGDGRWTITTGCLKRSPGRPAKVAPLFKVIGEKIPYAFLREVEQHLKDTGLPRNGVYIAHDSMGYPRYIGRGNNRLDARRRSQILELAYFSFFVVADKVYEREVETIMIRAAGPLLDFNDRKVKSDIQPGDVRDFEAGTEYVERQYKKGKRAKNKAMKQH